MSKTLTINSFKESLNKKHYKTIENCFNGNKHSALKFMSSVMTSVQKTPELLNCSEQSLVNAFLPCAAYQLYPSDVSGEAYVLPYKLKSGLTAQFQLGYQGLITLLYRHPDVKKVWAKVVYENDVFNYEEGIAPRLEHKPVLSTSDRGKPIAVYAVALINEEPLFHVMSEEDVMKFKNFSKSKNSEYSPWNKKNDPELTMWKKTCLKQLSKFLPKTSEIIHEAIAADNGDSSVVKKDVADKVDVIEGEVIESTEWKDKLDVKLMEMSNGEATPGDVWNGMDKGKYPSNEQEAQVAYAEILTTKNK